MINRLIQLKGEIAHMPHPVGGMSPKLPAKAIVNAEHLKKLLKDLNEVTDFWKSKRLIEGVLVSVEYTRIVAKSNRIKEVFKGSNIIRGCKFSVDRQRHIITYYLSQDDLKESIRKIGSALKILNDQFGGELNAAQFEAVKRKYVSEEGLSKTAFLNVIRDCCFSQRIFVDKLINRNREGDSIVSLYKIGQKYENIFSKLGIRPRERLDDSTYLLGSAEVKTLEDQAGYLISMEVEDLAEFEPPASESLGADGVVTIPSPRDEPTVGVIDTLFDSRVYFEKWVDFRDCVSDDISKESADYKHGTEVTSIIVDGPASNPSLEDDCGRFRVRHFGVAVHGRFSTLTIMRKIENIVKTNPDIKVWNLSLGSQKEISPNFISFEAAELDRLQQQFNVIFVIAGTNQGREGYKPIFIGSPADAINGITVNATDRSGDSAPYSRRGPVLNFFVKPDLCCFGGKTGETMRVCTGLGQEFVKGTSFAAPWITRKVAFLVYKMHFPIETAKALLIDSCMGWDNHTVDPYKGFGNVPLSINDVIYSKADEIRFIIQSKIEDYEHFNYRIPVPLDNGKHNYVARATLCYLPVCFREQGVDYTATELDLKFGRVKTGPKPLIKDLSGNIQDREGEFCTESDARDNFQKWNNVKVIFDKFSPKTRSKKACNPDGFWGLNIKSKERLDEKHGVDMPYTVVVTLKNIKGENRINDFVKACQLNGWIVQQVDVKKNITISEKMEETISFS